MLKALLLFICPLAVHEPGPGCFTAYQDTEGMLPLYGEVAHPQVLNGMSYGECQGRLGPQVAAVEWLSNHHKDPSQFWLAKWQCVPRETATPVPGGDG